MGTKVQCKSYLPGYYPMRDLNEDSSICSRSLYYEDKVLTDDQYYNGFFPKVTNNHYPCYDKDLVRQKMLEHEAVFKNQVFELHRLYRVQRDLMVGVENMMINHSFRAANSIYVGPSVSGVKGINSPLSSSTEGNNLRTSTYSSQNGTHLNDIEALKSRPSKVHRKMFDLQLPADEYIDTEEGEQTGIDKVASSSSSYPRNNIPGHDNGQKTDDRFGGIIKPDARLRVHGFADLNEPIQVEDVEETNGYLYNFSNGKIHDLDRSPKPNNQLLGLSNEISLNSYGRNIDDAQSNSHTLKNRNGSEWFSRVPEIGQRKVNSQFPHSFQQAQISTSKGQQKGFGADIPSRPQNLTYDATSLTLPQNYFPELTKPWACSWEKSNNNFSSKLSSAQTYGAPIADTLSQNSLVSSRRDYPNGNATSKPDFARVTQFRNGFFNGNLVGGSKEQPIRISSSGDENENRLTKHCKALNGVEVNLNVAISDSLSTRESPMPAPGLEVLVAEKKRDDHLTILPWLRAKPACKTEVVEFEHSSQSRETSSVRSSTSRSPNTTEEAKDCNLNFGASGDEPSPSNCQSNKKLLGFPIFEKPHIVSENNLSSPRTSENGTVHKPNTILDINLPCDPATPEEETPVAERVKESKSANFRHQIDLNSCLNDDDDYNDESPLKPKLATEIDLEAPAVSEPEEEDEEANIIIANAAEAILAIAASKSLTWFAETILSSSEIDDHFESMVLQLEETKEEDYTPAPPPVPAEKEAGPSLAPPTRPARKGQGKRGRQRRDFQRDILPGLVSLSRHEVTEDLQLIGGLLRATGQAWQSGPTRAGGRRGRRQAAVVSPAAPPPPAVMQMLNCSSENHRSLTGWGKTTRRPRRQRCSAGSSVAILN